MKTPKSIFSSEAMLCLTFMRNLPDGWTAFPESGGFDIVLVRDEDGAQIGVEAKLTLNAKVISQAAEPDSHWRVDGENPDFRAILIPYGRAGSFMGVCHLLGITVIQMKDKATWEATKSVSRVNSLKFRPELPPTTEKEWLDYGDWIDWAPTKRITLPDYIPDVVAGASGPVKLTTWKVKAIKIAVIAEKRGHVMRSDFKHLRLHPQLWLNGHTGWLVHSETRGKYLPGPRLDEFKGQHPRNYEEIAADYENWRPPEGEPQRHHPVNPRPINK